MVCDGVGLVEEFIANVSEARFDFGEDEFGLGGVCGADFGDAFFGRWDELLAEGWGFRVGIWGWVVWVWCRKRKEVNLYAGFL